LFLVNVLRLGLSFGFDLRLSFCLGFGLGLSLSFRLSLSLSLNSSLLLNEVFDSLLLIVGEELEGVDPLLEGELLLRIHIHDVLGVLVDLDIWHCLDDLESDDHLLSDRFSSWSGVDQGQLMNLVIILRLDVRLQLYLDLLLEGGVTLDFSIDWDEKVLNQVEELIALFN
jgi:hypothetical protein